MDNSVGGEKEFVEASNQVRAEPGPTRLLAPVLRKSRFEAHLRMWMPYIATLCMLLGFGVLGHSTHWSLPGLSAHEKHGGHKMQPSQAVEAASELVNDQSPNESATPSSNVDSVNAVVFTTPEGVSESGIKTEIALDSPLVHEIVCSAEVQYNRRRTVGLSSRVPGVIYRVTSQWGQFVKAGELLAIIEAGDVGKLKSEFARTLFDWSFKEKTVQRYYESAGAIPMRQVLDAEGELRAAKVAMLSAEQALVNLGFSVDWTTFSKMGEDEVMLELRTLGFEGDVKKSLERVTASSNLLPLRAPIDGIIIGNDASIGESVSSEKPFMEVSDISRVWVTIDVRKEDASAIRLGQPVNFQPDGYKDSVQGSISWISTEVDEKTRTLKVRAEIDNPKNPNTDSTALDVYTLRANMFGIGRVQVRQSSGVTVNKESLHMDQGDSMLFVQTKAGTFEPRKVTRGISQGDRVEVIGDVEVGNLVAVEGSQMLKSELVLNRLQQGGE